MKSASAAFKALLVTGNFIKADIYTFTLVGGTVLRYTSLDADVTANGFSFSSGRAAGGPFFDRTDNKAKGHWKVGVEVDTLTFDVVPGLAMVEGLSFLAAARLGLFDGADLQLERAYMAPGSGPPWIATAGTAIVFVGRVAEVDLGRSLVTFTVNSHLELLNLNLPRNLFQASCVNSLYDTACGVSRAAYQVNTTVSSWQPATGTIATAYHGQASDWFDQGSITFTSGQNAGFARSIRSSASDQASFTNIVPMFPFPYAPQVGDAFTLLPGCDKTAGAGGCLKFNNFARFKGTPRVPTPENAV